MKVIFNTDMYSFCASFILVSFKCFMLFYIKKNPLCAQTAFTSVAMIFDRFQFDQRGITLAILQIG
jgi:hypothetical protein